MELCAITGNGKKLNIAQNKGMAMPGVAEGEMRVIATW
jgi:hypothetical protein